MCCRLLGAKLLPEPMMKFEWWYENEIGHKNAFESALKHCGFLSLCDTILVYTELYPDTSFTNGHHQNQHRD